MASAGPRRPYRRRRSARTAALGDDLPLRLADLGVDALSFGGTKQGMVFGEAVVFLREGLGGDFPYWQKASMQLASKMRFVSAQLLALYEGDLWLRNAGQANAMARRLEDAVRDIERVRLTTPAQANAVFPILDADVADRLAARFRFYPWDEALGQYRWMCAWDTTEADVDAFVAALREELAR